MRVMSQAEELASLIPGLEMYMEMEDAMSCILKEVKRLREIEIRSQAEQRELHSEEFRE